METISCTFCHTRNTTPDHIALPHPYRVEVVADSSGKFCGNMLTFATLTDAESYARDLWARWTLVTSWRIVSGPLDSPTVETPAP